MCSSHSLMAWGQVVLSLAVHSMQPRGDLRENVFTVLQYFQTKVCCIFGSVKYQISGVWGLRLYCSYAVLSDTICLIALCFGGITLYFLL